MKLIIAFLLGSYAMAVALAATSQITSTYVTCTTIYKPRKHQPTPIPTGTPKTLHSSFPEGTVFSTVNPTATSTPAQDTVTSTITTTATDSVKATGDQKIATRTKTHVKIVATTETITSTNVSQETVTSTSTLTSIVQTVSGFLPVASDPSVVENGGGSGQKLKRSLPRPDLRGRDRFPGHYASFNRRSEDSPDVLAASSVACTLVSYTFTQVVSTRTGTSTSTVFAPTPTPSTTQTTVTVTSVSTIPPPLATTTTTITTTSTTTSTATSSVIVNSTSTTTSTDVAVATPLFAACRSNNIINRVGNYSIGSTYSYPIGNTPPGNTDPVKCCTTCQIQGGCFGWYIDPSTTACAFVAYPKEQCDPTEEQWQFYGSTASLPYLVVGNGVCARGVFNPPG